MQPQLQGLTTAEVETRMRHGELNSATEQISRSYAAILRANLFTLFNGILAALLILVLIFGSLQDALFGIVLIVNPLIGIIQEIRAKRVLDRLAILNAFQATVIRNGESQKLSTGEIVLDDLIELKSGDQIIVDGQVVISKGLEISESLLSGESLPIKKQIGDPIYSGSFVVAGEGLFKVTRVGAQTYARKLAAEARMFLLVHSELISGINKFLRFTIWAMVLVAFLFLMTQFRNLSAMDQAVSKIIAALVGMVPQGLVLLTSIAFAVSVIRLGRHKVLVQELPAVETLARVDVVCLDKTGTLTEDRLAFRRLEKLGQQGEDIHRILQGFANVSSSTAMLRALTAAFVPDSKAGVKTIVSFSSERKWSALSFDKEKIWILGAPEILLEKLPPRKFLLDKIDFWAKSGFYVLLLGSTRKMIAAEQIPEDFLPVAFLLFEEQIREDVRATLEYFRQQNVSLKIISGDNPITVASVARRAGLIGFGQAIDARNLPADILQLKSIMDEYSVFGRVTPQQKRQMIKALRANGHVIAMVGDGVNDVLAVKEADLGIAMGQGAAATRAVAQIVLLNGKFSTFPLVMNEGRKVIANIERVANLFLTKTVYITTLAVAVIIAFWPFPFLPRHLTLIDSLTIGIPAFFLALMPTTQRYRSGFINRVLRFVIPAGLSAAAATFVTYGLARFQIIGQPIQATTAAFLALILIGFWVLGILSKPLTLWRTVLIAAMVSLFGCIIFISGTRYFFALGLPSLFVFIEVLVVAAVFIGLLQWAHHQLWSADRTKL